MAAAVATRTTSPVRMAATFDYLGIGGSDAHIVSQIGRCATRFPSPVTSETELVEALRAEDFEAISVAG